MKNIVKEAKSTIIALALWVFAAYKFTELGNTLTITLFVVGLGLLFAKDSLTLGLETLIKKKSEKL